MAERATAEGQLARVLEILPRATREGGVALTELAEELGATEREILRDLQEVYTRAYYHPAGSGEDVQVLIETDQVEVWTTGEFRRPPRLAPREAFALGLGLRVLAADAAAPIRSRMQELARRLDELLGGGESEAARNITVSPGATPSGVRTLLADAARDCRRCVIGYLKPGSPEAEPRTVDPYAMLAAAGKWYLVGFCHMRGDVRVFRLDRIESVRVLEDRFEAPADFDPGEYVEGGRVYRPGEHVEVTVRYSARIARWIAEHGPVESGDDGAVVVGYRVADPGWLVAHVLQYGPDAEVLAPAEMRERVREAATRVMG